MGIRDDFRQLADDLRELAGPGAAGFDTITNQLTIRTRVWSGGLRGVGTPTDTDLVIPNKYEVQEVAAAETVGEGGRYEKADLRIGPITPTWIVGADSGGFSTAQLNPIGADGTEIIYLLTGPNAGEYQLIDAQTHRPFSYFLIIRRRITTP